jgi:hypothetical protein
MTYPYIFLGWYISPWLRQALAEQIGLHKVEMAMISGAESVNSDQTQEGIEPFLKQS